MVLSPRALDRLSVGPSRAMVEDEFFTRPYSAESLRWRVEAMCIRSITIDDGSGPIIQCGSWRWAIGRRRATSSRSSIRRAASARRPSRRTSPPALQLNQGQRVLLVDADTVTGHVTTSLGLEQVRTVADSWRDQAEGGPTRRSRRSRRPPVGDVGRRADQLTAEHRDPRAERVADAIAAARRGFDFVIVDLHPSYSALNLAVFERADRILVPVTPDVPALRAAVQLRDVGVELGFADRLALVVNRANSGVSVADMERTVGMPALALIRSGGLLFVRAANEGRTVIEMYPKERITEDFNALAEILGRDAADRVGHDTLAQGGLPPLRSGEGISPSLRTADQPPPPRAVEAKATEHRARATRVRVTRAHPKVRERGAHPSTHGSSVRRG